MTIRFASSVTSAGIPTHTTFLSMKVNGKTVNSATNGTCNKFVAGLNETGYDKNGSYIVESIANITICSGSTVKHEFGIKEGAVLLAGSVIQNPTSSGTYKLVLTWNYSRQTGAPTYLEELHKLDRLSSSQYIPRNR